MRSFFAVLVTVLLVGQNIWAADHGVALLYHHVSDETPPSTSVSPAVFRRHLDFLEQEGFNVLPLGEVLEIVEDGAKLPVRTVSITFDDAYRSVYEEAAQMLEEKNWPFTVFVNTEAIDRGYPNYLSWDELRRLRDQGVEFGNHSHSHAHLVRRLDGESAAQWSDRVTDDIVLAGQRLKEELGVDPVLFAYPYGEHASELREIVRNLGYIGIAQQSGAVGPGFDRLAVPRFPMAAGHDDMKRFALRVNARPLPVKDVSLGPVVRVKGQNIHSVFSFILPPGLYSSSGLACYDGAGELMEMRKEGKNGTIRFSISLPDWRAGRRKINCTAPSLEEGGVYYWYSHLWLVKHPDGSWYTE